MSLAHPLAPNPQEIELARESSRQLKARLESVEQTVRLVSDDAEVTVRLPAIAVRLLAEMLKQLAGGNAVTVVPYHMELTTQQAADLLNVSRPHLIKLLESGAIPFKKIGKHRRVRFQDVMEYKERTREARRQALDELTAEAQRLDLPR